MRPGPERTEAGPLNPGPEAGRWSKLPLMKRLLAAWRSWSWTMRLIVLIVLGAASVALFWTGAFVWVIIAFSRNPIAH